jgi:hypothetical protein
MFRIVLYGLVAGALGFVLMWSVWHLSVDHAALHALINLERARQAAPVK